MYCVSLYVQSQQLHRQRWDCLPGTTSQSGAATQSVRPMGTADTISHHRLNVCRASQQHEEGRELYLPAIDVVTVCEGRLSLSSDGGSTQTHVIRIEELSFSSSYLQLAIQNIFKILFEQRRDCISVNTSPHFLSPVILKLSTQIE